MTAWPLVPLGELLTKSEEWTKLDLLATYRQVTVKLWGQGVVQRNAVTGQEIKSDSRLIVRKDQFLLSRIDARNGAAGLVPAELDGAVVSNDFPTFKVKSDRLDPRFLGWYSKTARFVADCKAASEGTTNRVRLKEKRFLTTSMPLPSLEEQRRILKQIEKIHYNVQLTQQLSNKADEEIRSLLVGYINGRLNAVACDRTVGEVLIGKPRNGWSAPCDNVDGGVAVLSLGAVSGFEYRASHHKLTSEPTVTNAHYWLREGDLLMTRSNTPELVGHAAIYSGHPFPCVYPDLMMRLDVDESLADKRFLHRWLMSATVREFIRHAAKGTSPTMKKISQGVLMHIPFPNLHLAEQQRIADEIEAIRLKLVEASRIHKEIVVSIGALMPSVLNHAFSGQL